TSWPSTTESDTTRPMVSALMSTWRAGSTLPLAETMASRSCRAMVSTVTDVAVERRDAKLPQASAPRTTTMAAPISSFFRFIYLPAHDEREAHGEECREAQSDGEKRD